MRLNALLVLVLSAAPVCAQESRLQADFRHEGDHIKESCSDPGLKTIATCPIALATESPLHVALGNLPPQNGFGLGLAFVEHYTPNEQWRLSWNVDGVRAFGGSWRTGAYLKIVHIPARTIGVVSGGTQPAANLIAPREYPVINVYAQAISLDKLFFFGLGPTTTQSGKSVFGMRQTIVGTNVILPVAQPLVFRQLRVSLLGGANGRFVALRGNKSEGIPSIEQLYDESRAPGLSQQPGFFQLEEGVRLQPSVLGGHLQTNYLVDFQQFLAGSDSKSSFHRWTVDLKHEVPLYGSSQSSRPKDTNGPDECSQGLGAQTCPPVNISRNREGMVGFRFLITESAASAGSVVPFYFQPTLGGSDIDGSRLLSSYQDYRFRGPKLMVLQESIEHSIWGPIGFSFQADQGKIALETGDLGSSNLLHSFSAGVTVRAGGFPVVFLSFAWGGSEGHHFIGTIDSTLLGGSSRPSLH
jgi:hypothetical protein